MFPYILNGINKSGFSDKFRSVNNHLLIASDGSRYFSSDRISCKNCSIKKHRNGRISYSHSVVTPVIVSPGNDKVISSEPEFIIRQDGHNKQDCENTAAERWLRQYGKQYRELKITILGDDLYCKEPVLKEISDQGFNFISVCKPDSHKTLYEYLTGADEIQEVTIRRRIGKRRETDTYRFTNSVPLRDGEDAVEVNRCELTTFSEEGNIIYRNNFVTDHEITGKNVIEIISAGRARWKIENENNNVLKTKGYNLEHNFGHGKKYLSLVLLTLNLLAFLFHTVLDMTDKKYQHIRKELPNRKAFFDDIRALTRYICFDSWDSLLSFMIRGLELQIRDTG